MRFAVDDNVPKMYTVYGCSLCVLSAYSGCLKALNVPHSGFIVMPTHVLHS